MALDDQQLVKPVKKLQKLIRKIDKKPSPEAVHDLRTNTRRFETIVEALALDGQEVGQSILKDLERFRKRAGKVRDMDVLTVDASTVHVPGEEQCSAQLLEYLGVQRRKHARRLYAEIRRRRSVVRKELKRTPAMLAKRTREKQNVSGARAATAAAVMLATQLAAPRRLGRDNLHPFRLKVKELRDVLQMAAGVGANQQFVDDLGKLKDAIGEWHDWQELAEIAAKVLDHGRQCRLLAELKRIANRKYGQALGFARTIRKKYLRESPKIPRETVWEAIAMLAA